VTWTFAETHNVTFNAAAPTGGNIPDTPSGSVSRTFPAAGSFPYRCTLHAGMNATVNVQ
jgi:plastocyanin